MTTEKQQRLIENWPWRENGINGRYLDVEGNPIIQARPLNFRMGLGQSGVQRHVSVSMLGSRRKTEQLTLAKSRKLSVSTVILCR